MNGDKEIMVINNDLLFIKMHFYGFSEQDNFDFESIILNNYKWMKKRNAENNQLFKQPIGYAIICNPLLKKLFVYQRSSKDENYSEKRLQGKYSCGVGGHIEKMDNVSSNPIFSSTVREVSEEVNITVPENPKIIGYINDNDDVGKVHFGILYLIETNEEKIIPKDSEIENGKLVSIVEFEQICNNPDYNVESWSKIALLPLKEYFKD